MKRTVLACCAALLSISAAFAAPRPAMASEAKFDCTDCLTDDPVGNTYCAGGQCSTAQYCDGTWNISCYSVCPIKCP